MVLRMPTYSIHFIVQSIPAMPRFFPLSPPPFSPIMFGLNKKSICFPFVYFEYTQALLCAYSRVWCTSSSYNAILEGRIHAFFVLLLSHCFAMKTSLARLHQRCSLRLFIPIFLPSYKSTTERLEVMRNFMMCQKAVIAFRGIQKYTPQPYKNELVFKHFNSSC